MLSRFGLLIACLTISLTAGLITSSSSSSLPENSQFQQFDSQELVWIDHGMGVFMAEVVEFRSLKETDRAYSTSEKPVYYVELRLLEQKNFSNPVQDSPQVIQLAVGGDMSFLEKNMQKVVRLNYHADQGKLISLYSLSC